MVIPEYHKNYYLKHKEYFRVYQNKYRSKNRLELNKKQREYIKNDLDKWRAYHKKYRSKNKLKWIAYRRKHYLKIKMRIVVNEK